MTTAERTAFLFRIAHEGAGLLLGTVSDDGTPRGVRAWGVRLVEDRLRLTFNADEQVISNASRGFVALTGADVRRLQSTQVKGEVIRVVDPDDDDLAVAEEQSELFFQAIHETDLDDLDVIRRVYPTRMMALEMTVVEVFDQTPGPRAGVVLTAGGGGEA